MENLVAQLKAAYNGKRVLVTGHNGFKGTWLVALLNYLGAEVHGLSLGITTNSPFTGFHNRAKHKNYVQDIRNYQSLRLLVEHIDPDLVFHLAAQALVLNSYQIPRETFEVNVVGTANVLDSLLDTSCMGAIVATTDKVYKNDNSGVEFQETDELWGYDPYSLSKTGTELVASAWSNLPDRTKLKVVTVRAGNVFGPGDRAENRLLPDLVRAWNNNESVTLRNPQYIRPWQFVLDPLIGYLLIGKSILGGNEVSPSYNFGPDDKSFVSVENVAAIFTEITHSTFRVVESSEDLESETLKLNSGLAKKELGWTPFTDLSTGIELLIKYEQTPLGISDINFLLEQYLLTLIK